MIDIGTMKLVVYFAMQDEPSAAEKNTQIQNQLEKESEQFPNELKPLEKEVKQKAALAVEEGWELDENGVIAIVAQKGLDKGYKAFAKIYKRGGLEDAKVRKASFRIEGRHASFTFASRSFSRQKSCIKLSSKTSRFGCIHPTNC